MSETYSLNVHSLDISTLLRSISLIKSSAVFIILSPLKLVFLLFFLNGLLIAVVNSNRRHRTTETDLPCVLFVIVDLLDEAAS